MEDQASDDDAGQDTGDAELARRKRRKSQGKPASLEEINEQWASTHAKQVTLTQDDKTDLLMSETSPQLQACVWVI
jgi:hypothetical protein